MFVSSQNDDWQVSAGVTGRGFNTSGVEWRMLEPNLDGGSVFLSVEGYLPSGREVSQANTSRHGSLLWWQVLFPSLPPPPIDLRWD